MSRKTTDERLHELHQLGETVLRKLDHLHGRIEHMNQVQRDLITAVNTAIPLIGAGGGGSPEDNSIFSDATARLKSAIAAAGGGGALLFLSIATPLLQR